MRFHTLSVADVRSETSDTVSVAFEVPDQLRNQYQFVQGQHLTLRRTLSGTEIRRSYSICSSVDEGELRIAVKAIPRGVFSGFVHNRLAAGEKIEVGSPIGHFNVPLAPSHRKRYAAFAAGSGITPLMSIIKPTLEREPRSRFTLVYGNRETGSIIFREALERLKNTYMDRLSMVHTLSREGRNLPLLDGRIDRAKAEALLESLVPADQHDEFFLCGPKGMIDAVREVLLEKNVSPSCIHYELFTPPDQHIEYQPESMPIQAQGSRSSVVVSLDSKSTTFEMSRDGDTLLEAVRRVRPEVPYACEGGVCATCRAKLIEGRVNMQLNFALEESDLSSGYVLTCQSVPLTDRVVIDFDDL